MRNEAISDSCISLDEWAFILEDFRLIGCDRDRNQNGGRRGGVVKKHTRDRKLDTPKRRNEKIKRRYIITAFTMPSSSAVPRGPLLAASALPVSGIAAAVVSASAAGPVIAVVIGSLSYAGCILYFKKHGEAVRMRTKYVHLVGLISSGTGHSRSHIIRGTFMLPFTNTTRLQMSLQGVSQGR